MGPLDHVAGLGEVLDELDVPRVLGGSLASSLMGEPRSTNDVDIALRLAPERVPDLVNLVKADYLASVEALTTAAATHDSFKLLHHHSSFKIDLFFLGDGDLDRLQIERRQLLDLDGLTRPIWVTAPEDVVLRKLWWFRLGGAVSDRQWNDVVAIIRVQGRRLDRVTLSADATRNGLAELLNRAFEDAGGLGHGRPANPLNGCGRACPDLLR